MATSEANTTFHAKTKMNTEQVRPLANFPCSPWGDRFLSFSLDNSELESCAKAMEKPKEELRRMIIDQTIDSNAKLTLIYSVYRLGLSYIFADEIDGQLDTLFKELTLKDYDKADLYMTSIMFQVFRRHGHKMSCDVFNKFKDHSLGAFKEYITDDTRGILSFYESTQLRIRGELILDEAFEFTKAQLNGLVYNNNLEGILERQVKQALERPYYKGMQIVEAKLYFSNYEEELSSNESLLNLAKAHFDYLRLLHTNELHIISKWWKDMKFQVTMPYTRDRVPETFLWILAVYYEPHYSISRIIATKFTSLVLLLDDTFDAYATIEESRLLTDAINRWKISIVEQLPEYIKPFYKILVNEFAILHKQLAEDGREHIVDMSKQAFQQLARCYLEEAEWRHSGHVPSFEEYMKNGLITSAYNFISKIVLVGMGEIVNEEALAWHESHPKILKASELMGRVGNDIMSFQFEHERGRPITSVDAYVMTFDVSEKEAIDKLQEMIENAWKDVIEGCLKPMEVSVDLLALILNLARIIDVAYRYDDAYTFPDKTFKKYIDLLLY